MIRNLKVLGLALVALLSMVAVGASAASAAESHCHSVSSTNCFTESNSLASDNVFTVKTGIVKCSTVNLSATGHKTATTITFNSVEYGNCKAYGVKATVAMNGCHYLAHITGSGPFTAPIDVVCPAGKSITVTPVGIACVLTVSAQTGLTTMTLTNSGGPSTDTLDLLAHINITNIHYVETGAECVSPGTHTDGKYTGTLTIKAYEDNAGVTGAQRGLSVT